MSKATAAGHLPVVGSARLEDRRGGRHQRPLPPVLRIGIGLHVRGLTGKSIRQAGHPDGAVAAAADEFGTPSAVNARSTVPPFFTTIVCRRLPVPTSQIGTERPLVPATSRPPSGENST